MDEHVLKTIYWSPSSVCVKLFIITLDGNKIIDIKARGGCNGNLKAISALLKGMDVEEAISKLKGITCGYKSTSCADQLAIALTEQKSNI